MARSNQLNKTNKKKKSLLKRIAVLAFAVYSIFMIADTQIKITERKSELVVLQKQEEFQRIQNKDLKRQIANGVDDAEIERIAREQLDYVAPNERVFVDVSGS